jgi:hypothetical protein
MWNAFVIFTAWAWLLNFEIIYTNMLITVSFDISWPLVLDLLSDVGAPVLH